MNPSQFKIYDASAGSGKTFTLVKEYLKLLFSSNNKDHFKHILAVTFTNKAAGEMKERIIDTLKEFSCPDILQTPNSMFLSISKELNLQPNSLHQKSVQTLNAIVHNYAAFDISTIDGFTHKVIRTFARDLKLPINFEVELDTNSLLQEAVDSLVNRAGTDKALTKMLVDFAIEKADDDKSWDVTYDLNKIAKLLVNENDIKFIKTLEDKTLEDFNSLKTVLLEKITEFETVIINISQSVLSLIEESGLEFDDFSRSSLPKHFQHLINKNYALKFDLNWQQDLIESRVLYPKRVTDATASTIESIQPKIAHAFEATKKLIFEVSFLKAIYKNITPLSALNSINKELKAIKDDQNKLLISEFNSLISNEIKEQPTPFIYERLGEKFRHYFIDEFQDTSKLQWENLIPLLDNTLSSSNGSTMLVGDAKQAIYRWRGGEAEQFINLYNKTEYPFQIEQEVIPLETNYRSSQQIISFNNRFFEFVSQTAFTDDTHRELFSKATQKTFNKNDGYVSISFINPEESEKDIDESYASEVLETIKEAQQTGFNLSDICILVRKKKHGFALAEYLSDNGIAIISSETLLIQRSPEVDFVNNLLKLLVKPTDLEVKVAVLNYIAQTQNISDKHDFFVRHIHQEIDQFFLSLKTFGIEVSYSELIQLSLYDLVETIVRVFNLVETSDAYIQFYLDFALEYSEKNRADISGFVEHYRSKKETLSIVSPEGQEAVQIMTIHKSKGLEFPVVVFPYADLNIYEDIEPKEWVSINPEAYQGFSQTLLNYSKNFLDYNENTEAIHYKHQSELELDSLNILYVVLTRAVEQLHVISKLDLDKKGEVNLNKYSGLFIGYLKAQHLWNDTKLNYEFGKKEKTAITTSKSDYQIEEQKFISTNVKEHTLKIVTKSALLWDTKQEEAIEKGNLLHNLLGDIIIANDIDFVLDDFVNSNTINPTQAKVLKPILTDIVNHPKLKNYFSADLLIYNEREIITKNGALFIPDKVVINSNNEATIIDYKTGAENKKHILQLETYQKLIEEMNIKVAKKILVYINDVIQVKEL